MAETESEEVVRAFLTALEARDLEAARAVTGPGFTMLFPGAEPMTEFAALMAWAKGRYGRIDKTVEAVESIAQGARHVVYVRGTLHGDWPDGTPFAGIRFIDRFELTNARITGQQVWNDLAEMRPAAEDAGSRPLRAGARP